LCLVRNDLISEKFMLCPNCLNIVLVYMHHVWNVTTNFSQPPSPPPGSLRKFLPDEKEMAQMSPGKTVSYSRRKYPMGPGITLKRGLEYLSG